MRAYEPPELTKYGLLERVRLAGEPLTCSPSNTAADCSCDCCFDLQCTNVGNPVQTGCAVNSGNCTTTFGEKCGAASEVQLDCFGS